ncbi:hypothetical protein [Nitrospira sp. Nam74]
MKGFGSLIALAAAATFGVAGSVYAAESMSEQGQQDQMEKQQPQDIQKDSELGMKEQSLSTGSSQKHERQLGAGSLGEDSKGGAGPSGTKGLPPGKAPGFEGANKDPERAPNAGGH